MKRSTIAAALLFALAWVCGPDETLAAPRTPQPQAETQTKAKIKTSYCELSHKFSEGAYTCYGAIISTAEQKPLAAKLAQGRMWKAILRTCDRLKSEPAMIDGTQRTEHKPGGKTVQVITLHSASFYCSGL